MSPVDVVAWLAILAMTATTTAAILLDRVSLSGDWLRVALLWTVVLALLAIAYSL